MADSTTNLDLIQQSQTSKEVTANALYDATSPASLYGRRGSTTTGLSWGYYGGNFKSSPTGRQSVANGVVALTASTTNYVEADTTTGAVSKNTTGFTSTGKIPLYKIVTAASAVSSYEDWRPSLTAIMSGGGAPATLPINLATDVAGDLPYANIVQAAGTSVLGVTGGSTADLAAIVAGADGLVLRRAAGALAFGAVDLASSGVTGLLPASSVGLTDVGNYFPTDNAEAALQKLAGDVAAMFQTTTTPYKAKTTLTSGDPGIRFVLWNAATQTLATQLNISETNNNNNDVSLFLAQITTNNQIILQAANNAANRQTWRVTSPAVDAGAYFTVPVALISGTYSFTGNESLYVLWQHPGPGLDISDVPGGGLADQVLTKLSTESGDYDWRYIKPAGSDKQVQFNDGGVFGGSANFTFDKVLGNLGIGATPLVTDKVTIGGTVPTDLTAAYALNIAATLPNAGVMASVRLKPAIAVSGNPYIGVYSQNPAGPGTGANFYHFAAEDATGTTGTYGYHSGIVAGTNKWNFYAAGGAPNYFAGRVGIGVLPDTYTTYPELQLGGTFPSVSGRSAGISMAGDIPAATTTSAVMVSTDTVNVKGALGAALHFAAAGMTKDAGASITNQYFFITLGTCVATNNVGFYGQIPAGGGNFNCYMDGTAPNYFKGAVQLDSDRGLKLTSQTSAAAAAAGTITNAPAAGNPTHWLKVTINGSNFAIPAWPG